MLSAWFRVIRVRFLLASVIAVLVGLAINWWQNSSFDLFFAILTMLGVIALHASVDLLNDFWDFKRGIDTKTKRTKVSGGTGVLPEGLLKPSHVYFAGVLFLIIGAAFGAYFVFVKGIIIAILLAFAIVSIYFYSTRIVDSGLSEVFVAVKGMSIVLGTYFIQANTIQLPPILGGMVVGILSSLVLFVTSFPDFEADKSKGRRTLVIVLGKYKASRFYWVFIAVGYATIFVGIITSNLPIFTSITVLTIPLFIKTGLALAKKHNEIQGMESIMLNTVKLSRITGILFVLGFLLGEFYT